MAKLRVLVLLSLLIIAPPANAAGSPKGVWYVGGIGGGSSSAYTGAIVALPRGRLGQGLAIRGGIDAGLYKYRTAAGDIKGEYVAGSAGLVYQKSGAWGWANFSAGPKFTRTKLSPRDPNNNLRGSRWDVTIQSDGGLQRSGWGARWLGSYGIRDEAYHARLQLGPKLGPTLSVGAELGFQGGRSYNQRALGIFVRTSAIARVELQATAGVTQQKSRGSRGYVGLALSQVF